MKKELLVFFLGATMAITFTFIAAAKPQEQTQVAPAAPADQPAEQQQGSLPMFEQLDQDNNGLITPLEYQKRRVPLAEEQRLSAFGKKRVGAVEGRTVVDAQGKTVGQVANVIINLHNHKVEAVIALPGNQLVAIPLQQTALQGNILVWYHSVSKEQLLRDYPYNRQWQVVPSDEVLLTDAQTIAKTWGADAFPQPPGREELQTFAGLDRNNDGVLTKEEAGNAKQLRQHWQEADQNRNGTIEEAEFSAFETNQALLQEQ